MLGSEESGQWWVRLSPLGRSGASYGIAKDAISKYLRIFLSYF